MKQNQVLTVVICGLLLMLIPKSALSQTKRGYWLAEGNLGNFRLSNNKYEQTSGGTLVKAESHDFGISVFPRMGYFLGENLVLGSTFSFIYQKTTYKTYRSTGIISSDGFTRNCQIGLIPFLRFYFTKNTKNRFYAQAGFGRLEDIGTYEESTEYNPNGSIGATYKNPTEGHALYGEFLIGFNHFFNDHVAFNSSVGYSYNKTTQTTTNRVQANGITYLSQDTKNTSVSRSYVWNFGFSFIIDRKNV